MSVTEASIIAVFLYSFSDDKKKLTGKLLAAFGFVTVPLNKPDCPEKNYPNKTISNKKNVKVQHITSKSQHFYLQDNAYPFRYLKNEYSRKTRDKTRDYYRIIILESLH